MFFIDGWVPLSDVMRDMISKVRGGELRRDIAEAILKVLSRKGREDLADIWLDEIDDTSDIRCASLLAWDCIDSAPKVGVLTASGQVILAGNKVMDWYDPLDPNGWCVNLFDGYIGSAEVFSGDEKDPNITKSGITNSCVYGPFLNCPVLLPDDHTSAYLRLHFISANDTRSAEASAVEKIIELHTARPDLKKSDIKNALFPNMKILAFEASYQEAAKTTPSLSKRGPKLKN